MKAGLKTDKVIGLKAHDIAAIKRSATEQAADRAFIMMLSMPLIVLRDKYGFGKKRLEKFSNYVLEQYQCFNEGYVTFEDLIKILKDEVGLEVRI